MKRLFSVGTLTIWTVFTWNMNAACGADPKNGKALFESRSCQKCHTVSPNESAKPGPTLAGISGKRDHAWLRKFIESPRQFKSDPTIAAEMKKYPVGMPPMKFREAEMADLLSYLDQLQ